MRVILFSLVVFAAACGSKSSPTGGGGTGPEPKPAGGPLAAGQWDSMDHEAREHFMEDTVMPAMAATFKGFDAGEFGNFDCTTCHGSGIADHTYKMPHPDLPALSIDEIMNPDEDHKAITEFMITKVKPEMATLLGKPEGSAENPTGFGCFNCHTQKP